MLLRCLMLRTMQAWIAAQKLTCNAPQSPETSNLELPSQTRKGVSSTLRWLCRRRLATQALQWTLVDLFLAIAVLVDAFIDSEGQPAKKSLILYGILVVPETYCVSRVSSLTESNHMRLFIVN